MKTQPTRNIKTFEKTSADKDSRGMAEGGKAEEARDANEGRAVKYPIPKQISTVRQRVPSKNKASVI